MRQDDQKESDGKLSTADLLPNVELLATFFILLILHQVLHLPPPLHQHTDDL